MDLYTELQQKTKHLDLCIKELRHSGTAFAEAEREYKVLLRTECLKLRDGGMAIGMIDSRPGVATAILKRLDVVEQRAELLKISATENKLRNSRKKASKYVVIESGKAVFKQSLPANYIRIFSNKFVSHYRHD